MLKNPITVFYDGSCGLCSREIRHYKRIAPDTAYLWIDITRDPEPLKAHGIAVEDALRIMHVQDQNGEMHRGVDAFVTLWSEMPYWRRLRPIVKLPLIYSLACFTYTRFAHWRFKRLGHCKIPKQQT